MAAVALAGPVFAVCGFRESDRNAEHLYEQLSFSLATISSLEHLTQERRRFVLNALTTPDADAQLSYIDRAREADTEASNLIDAARRRNAPAVTEAVDKLLQHWAIYLTARDDMISLALEGDTPAALARDRITEELFVSIQTNLDALRIVSRYGDRRPRLVALTAHALAEHRGSCMDAGMDDFLTKPIRPADLRGALVRASTARQAAA